MIKTTNHSAPDRGTRSQRGGALIELGLILPLLALVAVGATNIGLSLSDRQVLIEAARYGARRAVADGRITCVGPSILRDPNANGPRNPIGPQEEAIKPNGCAYDLLPENMPDDSDPYARDLAEYHACLLLQQSGLDLEKWRADATEVPVGVATDGVRAIYIELKPVKKGSYFTSTLMGSTFPSASAEFLLNDKCPLSDSEE